MDGMDFGLGATEQIVADKFAKATLACTKAARELLDDLEKIEAVEWAGLILDSEKKKSVLLLLDPLESLATNLGHARLTTLIVEAITKEPQPA